MTPIDINPADLETVRQILREKAPELEVRAFGSRVSWTARETSDLDLVLMTKEPLDISRMAKLKESFSESNLPFRIDIVDWADTSENFREIIESKSVTLPASDKTCESTHKVNTERENAVSKWKEVSIGEIAEVIGGGTPSTKDINNFNGDVPWLTPKDLAGFHDRYISRGTRNLSQKGLDSCSAKLLPKGTVLLSTRAPIGYVAIAKNPIATNQGFHSLIPQDGFTPEYIYYWMVANTKVLENHACGTTFTELSGSNLKQIRLQIPSVAIQESIAQILGTLDDKIELNRRTNETLEAMARALFKSWFVDFDPVRAKMEGRWQKGKSFWGLPANLYDFFPNRLVNSELGEIPNGWEIDSLANIATDKRQAVNPVNVPEQTPYIGLEHMPRHSIALGIWENAEKATSNKSVFKKGEFLFGKLRPYFHKVGVAPVNGICSTDIAVIEAIEAIWSIFVLVLISSDEFISYTNQNSTGTKMPRTSWSTMSRYKICIPPKPIVEVFQNTVQSMIESIIVNIHCNQTLESIRNLLLPKLISGKLKVQKNLCISTEKP